MARKVIVTVSVSGAETTKEQNPALPVTPQEIADSTYEAYLAGASIVHLHVRDDDGKPTQSKERFKEVIDLIRRKCDIIVEVSTGGAAGMSAEERLQPIMLDPEMCSLDCGSVNFGNEYVVNDLPLLREFAQTMLDHKVRPIQEILDVSQLYTSKMLIKEGLIKPPFYYGFGMNIKGAMPYTPELVAYLQRNLPDESEWTAVGIGSACLPCCLISLAMGGHMRVGFEDNVYYGYKRLAKSNAELVERCKRLILAADCEVATPGDVRKMLQLRQD